jgi:hypothetical protein
VSLEDYRVLFIVSTLGLALVAASPALSVAVPFRGGYERFSELWLLDPGHMAEDYPFDVAVGEVYSVFVGVGNHMDCSEYYVVYMKFRNGTQPLPNINNSIASPLPPLCEFRFFVGDGESWESLLTFEFQDVSFEDGSVYVGVVTVNGVAFSVDASARWDSGNGGFYFQLFFELWRFDVASQGFRFHNRFVGLWLNISVS